MEEYTKCEAQFVFWLTNVLHKYIDVVFVRIDTQNGILNQIIHTCGKERPPILVTFSSISVEKNLYL